MINLILLAILVVLGAMTVNVYWMLVMMPGM